MAYHRDTGEPRKVKRRMNTMSVEQIDAKLQDLSERLLRGDDGTAKLRKEIAKLARRKVKLTVGAKG